MREVRDPLHGFVYLSDDEWKIVNHPVFQRLRDIKQLAMGHFVYPGATHTRFEHSIGVVHVASSIFDRVVERSERGDGPSLQEAFSVDASAVARGRQILRLASLLHDLGHPPFSHSGETLMPEGINHEHMTVNLVKETDLSTALRETFGNNGIHADEVLAVAVEVYEDWSSLTGSQAWYLFLRTLLTGELGADRIDYLLRDALHSGQPAATSTTEN